MSCQLQRIMKNEIVLLIWS